MSKPFPTDPILAARELRKEKQSFDWLMLLLSGAVFAVTLFVYAWQYQFTFNDLHVHARIASEFDFRDLHTITSRLAYPMWHLCVTVLYQLGMPLIWASALVCAAAKTFSLWLSWLLLRALTRGEVSRPVLAVSAFLLMFVTGLRLPWFNPAVYRGVGSPTVWHNPTQLMAIVSMFLCVPYLAHCWYSFESRLPERKEKTLLPWHQAGILAALLMFSLACKPTFMQALIPAAAIFFLAQWIRHPHNSRFFFQIILVFLPAALYFLLQFLYYTGVVVPYTSGVAFGATWESAWEALRSMLIMAAFPLFAALCVNRRELTQDKMLVLTWLTMAVSVLEAMFFRETGLRYGHGNFNWGSMNAALMLWVLMTGHFLRSLREFKNQAKRSPLGIAAFSGGFALLAWHVYSGGYYLYYLITSNNSF